MLHRTRSIHATLSSVTMLALLILVIGGCDSTDANEEPSADLGEASFTISGDVEDDLSGIALFDVVGDNFQISINDRTPQTYALNFEIATFGSEELPIPTGTYTLFPSTASLGSVDEQEMMATYTRFDNDDFAGAEYLPNEGVPGQLEITASTSTEIEGTFSLEATIFNTDEYGEGAVTIENGSFRAVLDD